jgi:hypothetical protein
MDLLRKLKHWHLFLIIVGIPFVIQFIQSILFLASDQDHPETSSFLGLILIIPLVCYFLWIRAVGKFSESPDSPQMNTRKFQISWWISILTHLFLLIYFWSYPQNLNRTEEDEVIPIMVVGLIVFVALFTLFYCLSFMARAIVQLERGRRITSSEYFSEFIMAVIFPIGIWLLQPRINRLSRTMI